MNEGQINADGITFSMDSDRSISQLTKRLESSEHYDAIFNWWGVTKMRRGEYSREIRTETRRERTSC